MMPLHPPAGRPPPGQRAKDKGLRRKWKNFFLFLQSFLVFGLWSLVFVPSAHAQDLATSACVQETYYRLGVVQREYRSVVLGQRRAQDQRTGAIRYDSAGQGWVKTAANTWRPLGGADTSVVRSDAEIDAQAEFPARPGILETKRILTSDLIPPILQAFRALQCRTRAVCLAAQESQSDVSGVITVQPRGCIAFSFPPLTNCRLQQPATGAGEGQKANFAEIVVGLCERARLSLIGHEENALKMLAAYDASYRTLLQFAGSFHDFINAFGEPVLLPFWQAARVIHSFRTIPCFTAQCDE